MTLLEAQKIVQEACVKAVPEIVELKLGCRIILRDGDTILNERIVLKNKSGMLTTFVDVGITFSNKTVAITDLYEILGRDIRLADVLAALTEATLSEGCPLVIDTAGQFYDLREQTELGRLSKIKLQWDCLHDSLSWHVENRPETVIALAELLASKN